MARKPKFEGIGQRVDAKGVARYRAQPMVDGQRRYGGWTTDPEAAAAERDRLRRDGQMGLLSNRRLKLGEAIDEFTTGIREGYIRNKTGKPYRQSVVRLYSHKLERVRQEFGAKSSLDAMRVPHVDRFRDRLLRAGASDSEVHNIITALRAMYVWALRSGYATINPCVGIPLPISDRRPRRIAPKEECRWLTTAVVGRDRTAFALAWLAGLRAGELLALAWPGHQLPMMCNIVDLEAGVLRIDTAIDTTTRDWVDEGPKTYASRRTVMLREQLVTTLEDHAAEYGTTGLLFPADRVHHGRLRSEVPMAYTSLVQRLKRAWAGAGLERLDLHEARHTFASMLIAAGARPEEVKEEMGHASIIVTYDIYGHLFPRDREDLRRRMNEYDAQDED